MPWRKLVQHEDALEQRDVVADGGARDLKWRGELAHVDEPGGLGSRQLQQLRDGAKRAYAREVSKVTLDQGVHVVHVPLPTPRSGASSKRCREPAGRDARGKLFSEPGRGTNLEVAAHERMQEPRLPALDLALRHRMKADRSHAPRKRVSHLRHQKHVRRSGEKKSSGYAVTVDLDLQWKEELGRALHFVDDHTFRKPGNEAGGIVSCSAAGGIVVEIDVLVAAATADPQRKRGLAALASPMDHHHRRVG